MTTDLNSSKNDLFFIVVANSVHGIFEVETEAEAIDFCGGSERLSFDDFKDSLDTLGEDRSIWCKVDIVKLDKLHDEYGVETIRPIYAALYLSSHDGFQADLSEYFYTEEEATNFISVEQQRIIREKYSGDEDKFYNDDYAPDYVFTKIGQ